MTEHLILFLQFFDRIITLKYYVLVKNIDNVIKKKL